MKRVREARLVLVTTVRVNPSGAPFRLGVAIARRERVLCVVEGAVRGLGYDRVLLEERDGVTVARPAPRRRLRDSRA